MASRLNVYATSHVNSRAVCAAFADGSGAPIVPPAPLLPGDVAMYGCLRGLLPTLKQAQREGRAWYYLDNGYFRAGHYHGYYRATRNAYQHDGSGRHGPDRFERLGLEIKPWRAGGRHVLVCPPGDVWAGLMDFDAADWLRATLAQIAAHTDRPVVVRHKKTPHPLSVDLTDCWALVTYMSNVAVTSLLEGVPVFATGPCAAARMGRTNLLHIESAYYPPDREQWAWNLAANQWTLDEMRAGLHRQQLGIT